VPQAAEPDTTETRSLLTRLVTEALAGLTSADKLLLHLYYEQNLSLDQMGVALHASKAKLSRRLTRSALCATVESHARRSAGVSADALRAPRSTLAVSSWISATSPARQRGTKPISCCLRSGLCTDRA
jgi:hypothetical protein